MTADRRPLALFVLMVAGAAVLTLHDETADREMADFIHNACQQRQANVLKVNHLNNLLINIERTGPDAITSPTTVERRIAAYQGALLTYPDC